MQHVIRLVEKPSPHALEKRPRFDVTVNGDVSGELYYNMKGYVGALPTVHGADFVMPEAPISAWKRMASALNREAKAALASATNDPRKVMAVYPTEDPRLVLLLTDTLRGDSAPGVMFTSRAALIGARKRFGGDMIGAGYFQPEFSDDMPIVLLPENASYVADLLPVGRSRLMSAFEAQLHDMVIDHADVWVTDDPDVLVVVGRYDEDAEPIFADAASVRFAMRQFPGVATLGDVRPADPVRVSDPRARGALAREFPWLDLDASEDAAVAHQRRQDAMSRAYALVHDRGEPLDAAERHQFEQEALTGPE